MGIFSEIAEKMRLQNEAERLRQRCQTCQFPLIALESVIVPVFHKLFGILGSEDLQWKCDHCFLMVRFPKNVEYSEIKSVQRALERQIALFLNKELKDVVKAHLVSATTESVCVRVRW